MATLGKWLTAVAFVGGLVLASAPAWAQVNPNEPDPSVWLRQIYDEYHRTEEPSASSATITDEVVEKRASKSLATLFKKEKNCVVKSKEICALDWDFVIDGQDWKLSNIKVGPLVASGDKGSVKVTFTNLDADCVNVFYFVREGGQWKVEDVETQSGKDAPTRVSKILKDYKY